MSVSDWVRVPPPKVMLALSPNARVWQRRVEDGYLEVFRTIEEHDPGQWVTHISICHKAMDNTPGRYPTWEEQKEACFKFAPGKDMHSILLRQDDPSWVNVHETTFHWWELT